MYSYFGIVCLTFQSRFLKYPFSRASGVKRLRTKHDVLLAQISHNTQIS